MSAQAKRVPEAFFTASFDNFVAANVSFGGTSEFSQHDRRAATIHQAYDETAPVGVLLNELAAEFGDLLVRAQRDNGKTLVRDVVHDVNIRLEREAELKRHRAVGFDQKLTVDRGQSRGR